MLRIWVVLLCTLLAACTTTPKSRYSIQQDRGPTQVPVDIASLPELQPKYEPKSRRGNAKQYQVWGKTYQSLDSAEHFKEVGTASWYGEKFHGHTTSNGERYDMYQFSAAHKHLPLPTYVRVTNLDNQKSLIVRVNDRGPFHGDRVIDLSYAAAVRLGFAKNGTAPVKVEAITVASPQESLQIAQSRPKAAPAGKSNQVPEVGTVLQVRSYSNSTEANKFKLRLASLVDAPVFIETAEIKQKKYHRVKIGPIAEGQKLTDILELLDHQAMGAPLLLPNQRAAP